ncbi:hypothetical protein SH449x_001003 [Pirellulaceae bacterium SH449]
MARCDQGYLCRVCGEEVEKITDSELYLRFVIGEVDPEILHTAPECHLTCAPSIAQFIVDDRFPPVSYDDPLFGAQHLDPSYVAERRELVSRGYTRLWEIRKSRKSSLAVVDYPLPEVVGRWKD